MNALKKKTAGLRRESNRQRVSLIETDIETARTFLQLADTELGMGNIERVTRLVLKARTAHEAMGTFLTQVADPKDRKRLGEELDGVDEAILDMERRARSRWSSLKTSAF